MSGYGNPSILLDTMRSDMSAWGNPYGGISGGEDSIGNNFYSGLENLSEDPSLGSTGGGMGGNGLGMLGGIADLFKGITMSNSGLDLIKDGANYSAGIYRQAGKVAMEGAAYQASVYRQAKDAVQIVTNYNIALDQQQTARQQDSFGRQIKSVFSSNNAKIGYNNLGGTSRSSMMVQNDVISTAERQFTQNKNDALQRQSLVQFNGDLTMMQDENAARAAEYSGAVANMNYENEARKAKYQGKIQEYQAKSQQAESIGGAVGSIFKMFGGM